MVEEPLQEKWASALFCPSSCTPDRLLPPALRNRPWSLHNRPWPLAYYLLLRSLSSPSYSLYYNRLSKLDQRQRRGHNLNLKALNTVQSLKDQQSAARMTLTIDTYTKKFIGETMISFLTKVGIVRSCCGMKYHTWEKIPKENKEEMIDRLRENFELPQEDRIMMEYVDEQLRRQWKRTRNTLKD
ncbi:unnamed protein product [Lactuca virosa]|uniref:Uncharacterized protein n=1 Tax=Lactuca virosa TaxID=75947 RepID=A0AAU9PS83_9ASTR|nr:unnamed protein product [Lactuca virosa]